MDFPLSQNHRRRTLLLDRIDAAAGKSKGAGTPPNLPRHLRGIGRATQAIIASEGGDAREKSRAFKLMGRRSAWLLGASFAKHSHLRTISNQDAAFGFAPNSKDNKDPVEVPMYRFVALGVLLFQLAVPSVSQTSPDVPEPGSVEAIAAATTDHRFLSPWVSYLPKSSSVPSPPTSTDASRVLPASRQLVSGLRVLPRSRRQISPRPRVHHRAQRRRTRHHSRGHCR